MERDILQMLVKECFQSSTPLCTTTPVRTTTVPDQLHPYHPSLTSALVHSLPSAGSSLESTAAQDVACCWCDQSKKMHPV